MVKKKIKLYKMFTKWCLSYLVISLVALTVIIFCSVRYSQVLEDELEYINAVQLETTQLQIDQKVESLRSFGSRATLNRMVDELRQLDSWEEVSRYDLYQFVRDMQEESLSNEGFGDCYLYFPLSDLMISGNYYNNSKEFYDIVFQEYGIQYEDWYQIICDDYIAQQIFSIKRNNGEYLTVLVRPLDSSSRRTPPANAIMIMDMNEILKSTDWLELDRDQICIVDLTNQRLVCNSPLEEEVEEGILSYALEYRQEDYKSGVAMGDSVVSFVKSQYENWDYVVSTREQPFVVQIQNLQNLIILLMILYLLVSAGVIGYAALRYYRPIRDLIFALQQGGETDRLESENDKDAYDYITRAVNRLVDKNRENEDVINRQRDAINRATVHRLLMEKQAYSLMDEEVLKRYGIPVTGCSCCILAYRLDEQTSVPMENPEDTCKISKFILQNVTEENLEQEKMSWVCFHEGEHQLVFFIWETGDGESLQKRTLAVCEKSLAFVRLHFKFSFQAALSEMHTSAADISQAYEEAKRVFEYQKTEKGKDIVSYGEINLLPGDTLLRYPRDAENRLVHWIQNGNEQEACNEIKMLLRENQTNCLEPEAMQFLVSSIATSIIRAAEKVAKKDSLFAAQKQLLNTCHQGDAEKMQVELEQMVVDVCRKMAEYKRQEKDNQKVRIYLEAKTYIEENYSDPGLNVNSMAEHLGVQPTYLSKLFKEMEGEKLSQYLSKVRLKYVKKLLLENEKLEEISVRCGFGSQRTFLRIFKQYEGVTPTQFKELEEEKKKEGTEG